MVLLLFLQVIDGGDLDVHFSVKNPAGQVLISDLRKTENYHRLFEILAISSLH